MHIETLEAVHQESKRLPPIQKVKAATTVSYLDSSYFELVSSPFISSVDVVELLRGSIPFLIFKTCCEFVKIVNLSKFAYIFLYM